MSWHADWPWLVGIPVWLLIGLTWFTYWERKGFRPGSRIHTLSRFVWSVGHEFPLSLVAWGLVFGLLFGGLSVHFFWHWCPDIGVGIGRLNPTSAAYGAEPRNVPDPALTPGVVRELSLKEICTTKWGRDRRLVTAAMKRQVREAYHFHDSDCPRSKHKSRVEIDHVIPRCAGGADDVLNLQPQCYGGDDNATQKDRLEAFVCKAICSRDLELKDAQDLFRTRDGRDWRDSYRERFGDPN